MSEQDARPWLEPEIAALSAGLALVAVDVVLLGVGARHGGSQGTAQLVLTAGAVILSATAVGAVAARLALGLTALLGQGRWLRSLAGALMALPVILPLSYLLFRGTGISARWYAPYGPFIVAPALYFATAVGLRLAGVIGRKARTLGPTRRTPLALAALALAGLALWADRSLYPNQYHYLHWVLLLVTFVLLMGSAWLAFPRRETGRASRARWLAPALLAAAVPAAMVAACSAMGTQRMRQAFSEQTHAADRLVRVWRDLADWDGDHHSVVFGEQDCDNRDPRVHPFAAEVPGNGIDEDCDGKDLTATHAPATAMRALDDKSYRQRLGAWLQEPELSARLQETARHNVVLVVLDALRADQVGPSSPGSDAFPNVMRLLAESRSFSRAFSTGAGTDIGMATIFTGQLDPFTKTDQMLLSAFSRAGYHTHGVFQREVERWVGRQFSLKKGLASRDLVVNDPHRRDLGTRATSKLVTERGIRFLQRFRGKTESRFFLWLHYFDIHEHHQIKLSTLDDGKDEPEPARGLPFYRRMVQHVDLHLGRFMQALSDSGLKERTIVVLVGDHGEGLAQAPRLPFNHGDVLFNPLVHVPMAFLIPGVEAKRVDAPVSLADLCPTLLDLSGIERSTTDGISLVPFLFDAHLDRLQTLTRPLFMYEVRQRGVILWPWKLLTWLDQGLVELYHLEHDYEEENNRADDLPEVTRRMARILNSKKLITIDRLAKRTR